MAMSRPAKSALRSVHRRIAMDLQLTEDFYGGLVEKKIFPRDIIDVIKVFNFMSLYYFYACFNLF